MAVAARRRREKAPGMLHAAAMFLFFSALAAAVLSGAGSDALTWRPFAIAAICVLTSARFGGISPSYGRFVQNARLRAAHAGASLAGAARCLRAALSADVAVNPALLRLRHRAGDQEGAAQLAAALGAAPGTVAVDADAESLLVHVIDEGSGEVPGYLVLEAIVAGAEKGRAS
jgi:multisubunit Na+/H+ antiporter MnhE subunit